MTVRLSGASQDIIDKTGILKERELIKYSRYGQCLLIPAIFALIAGGFTVHTLTENYYIYILGAIIWGWVVLRVDMYFAASLYKTKREKERSFWAAVVFRLVFSIVVGMTMSHPLVLFVFNDEIIEQIGKSDRKEKRQELLENTKESNEIKAVALSQQQINALEAKEICLNKLITMEQTKQEQQQVLVLDCGATTGREGCGAECQSRKQEREKVKEQLQTLREQQKSEFEPIDGKNGIAGQTQISVEKEVVTGYLARTKALQQLSNEEGNFHVKLVTVFLAFVLILLDCLVILGKAFTPMGAYEYILDSSHDELINKLGIKNEVKKTFIAQKMTQKMEFNTRTHNIFLIEKLYQDVQKKMAEHREQFDMLAKKKRRSVSIFNRRKRREVEEELAKMYELSLNVQAATFHRLNQEIAKFNAKTAEENNAAV